MISFTEPKNRTEAVAIQKSLAVNIVTKDDFGTINTLAGVDVGFDNKQNLARAAIVLIDANTGELMASSIAYVSVTFPYITGLLSFREIPALLAAYDVLSQKPDLIFMDGHGIAHPRRMGIASHLGVLLDKPTIGIAKKKLYGRYDEPVNYKGASTSLENKDGIIGTVLRSKVNTKPLFISPGHKISQETALKYVMAHLDRYRLPEPTRLADKLSKHTNP